jgi:hypothetical protein
VVTGGEVGVEVGGTVLGCARWVLWWRLAFFL